MRSIKVTEVIVYSLFSVILLFSSDGFSDNPVVQTCYTADPAPMVYNGRVYMYVGHDSDGAAGSYLMRNWKCYSSSDMANWTDHGVMLSTGSINWSTSRDANAAQVIYRNGKFYYYVSTTASGGVTVGVAVSNSPIGPFKDTLGQPLIAVGKMTGCNATHSWRGLDPTVFIDDDGQAYLYWGNNVLYWVRLNADMISTSGAIGCLAQNDPAFGPDYEEGPWFYKRNSLYYLLYPSGLPETIHYSTSSGPTGPWTYKNRIMAVDSYGSSTIHPGACDFGGNSYYFYHNAALPGGGSYKRSVCIEKFTYNTDGTIPSIAMTKAGPPQIGHLNPYDTTQAETICWETGVKTEPCSEGGIDVDSIHNGDFIKVKGVDFGSGALSFDARVASATSGGSIELHLDTLTGPLIGTCAVAGTGGWQKWEIKSCTVSGATGVHDLYLKFTGGSGLLFNFNWWKFDPKQTGIKETGAKKPENGGVIKVTVDAGKAPALRLDFLPPVSNGNLNVRLFDLTGRLVTTLFTGRLSVPHMVLPLNREEIRPGGYVLSVSINNNVLVESRLILWGIHNQL
jgi:arabinoxylan arabinofuranohydrolase